LRRVQQVLTVLLFTLAALARAQSYPVKPVHIVVPYAAGGTYDLYARAIGQKLSEMWGQPVIIEDRSGANGIAGTDFVAKSAPDGYTIMMGGIGPHGINPSLYSSLPYDPIRDFAPVIYVAYAPNVLIVNPSIKVQSVKDLILYARSRPGQLTFSSAGSGSSQHLSAELFNTMTGIRITHIPYRGGAPGATAVLAGEVSLMFASASDALKYVGTDRVRMLAVTSARRIPAFPEVPTMIEAGVPGFMAAAWFGVLAPAATQPEIVNKLNRDIGNVLKIPEVAERVSLQGSAEIVGGTPEQFGAFIRTEIAKWAAVVKASGAKVD
jgi:tripartite-type tricarboxylate transporter receptor subunit TctC